MNNKTQEEKIQFCLAETHKHAIKVQQNINIFVKALLERGEKHDESKFSEPELPLFADKFD